MMRKLITAALACAVAAPLFAAAPAAAPTTGAAPAPAATPAATFVPPPPDVIPVCSRESLQAAVDSYVAAQKAGDAKKLTFADKVRYLENMSEVAPDKGLWNTALPVAYTNSILDSKRCKTFTEIVVTEGDHQYVIGTRLYVDGGKITRIDSLVSAAGGRLLARE